MMTQPSMQDLGRLADPLLIFGGIYGNLEAFDALVAKAAELGVAPEHMIHTGDVAAYCADTFACADKLQALGCPAIKGNVEEQLAESADDCACGFDEGSECDLLAMRWYAMANAQTTPDLRRWMAALPDHLSFSMQGRRFVVVHGSPRLINEFMFCSLDDARFTEQLDQVNADCIIAGHTGLPFTKRIGPRLWHNSGALGLPANDATQRVWFSVLTPQASGIEFSFHALEYDYRATAAKMRDAGLPQGYAQGLETGLWPNTDILPAAESAETGVELYPRSYTWPSLRAAAE